MEKNKCFLIKDGVSLVFDSQSAAGRFLGISREAVSDAIKRGGRCGKWKVARCIECPPSLIADENKEKTWGLRVNNFLMPNKTERAYYKYLAEKGAKA